MNMTLATTPGAPGAQGGGFRRRLREFHVPNSVSVGFGGNRFLQYRVRRF